MPDRYTPEYERVIAKMGASLPTGVPGHCCRSSCRSTTFLRWRRRANARSARARGWKAVTLITILSDGAEGPRALGEAASPGPTHHVANGKELAAVAARKVARLLRDLETYICGQSDIIIDCATARY
jgi:hypothetical protein